MATKKNIGEIIRQIRETKNIDIDTLALRSNTSKDIIEAIEDEKILPPLNHIIKISRSLGVQLSNFIDENQTKGPIITLAEEKDRNANFINKDLKTGTHMNFFSLAENKANRHMEPFIIDIKPGNANDYKLSSHEGEEFVCVLEGSIEINYGKEVFLLHTGDSIYYDSIVNHNLHAYNNENAKILAVIYVPE